MVGSGGRPRSAPATRNAPRAMTGLACRGSGKAPVRGGRRRCPRSARSRLAARSRPEALSRLVALSRRFNRCRLVARRRQSFPSRHRSVPACRCTPCRTSFRLRRRSRRRPRLLRRPVRFPPPRPRRRIRRHPSSSLCRQPRPPRDPCTLVPTAQAVPTEQAGRAWKCRTMRQGGVREPITRHRPGRSTPCRQVKKRRRPTRSSQLSASRLSRTGHLSRPNRFSRFGPPSQPVGSRPCLRCQCLRRPRPRFRRRPRNKGQRRR